MLNTIQSWLQGYIDKSWVGQVNLFICDGIPGNCTLRPLQTKLQSHSCGLTGFTRWDYRSLYHLTYLSTNQSNWMEELATWCQEENAMGDQPFRGYLETIACKRLPNGTYEYTAILAVDYQLTAGGETDV